MDPIHTMINSDLLMSQISDHPSEHDSTLSHSVASLQICSDSENDNNVPEGSDEDFEHVAYEEVVDQRQENEPKNDNTDKQNVENVTQEVEMQNRHVDEEVVESVSLFDDHDSVHTAIMETNLNEIFHTTNSEHRNDMHEDENHHEIVSVCDSFDQISHHYGINPSEYSSLLSEHEYMGDSNRIDSYFDDDVTSIGSTLPADWHEDVVNKLIDVFGEEEALPIITYLSMNQEHRDHLSSGVWKMLHSLLTKDELFKKYVEESILPHATIYVESEVVIHDLSLVIGPLPEFKPLTDSSKINHFHWTRGAIVAFFKTLPEMPLSIQAAVLRRMFINPTTSEGVLAALKVSSTSAIAVLSLVGFALEASYILVWRWFWNKDIGGVEVAKRLVNALLATAAATGGGIAGASIGALAGPVGAIIGGIVGGVAGAISENLFFHKLYKWIFIQPRHKSLKQAYDFLQVAPHASNAAINGAYSGLLKSYHPDKGGNPEDYHKLVSSYLLIKAAREPERENNEN